MVRSRGARDIHTVLNLIENSRTIELDSTVRAIEYELRPIEVHLKPTSIPTNWIPPHNTPTSGPTITQDGRGTHGHGPTAGFPTWPPRAWVDLSHRPLAAMTDQPVNGASLLDKQSLQTRRRAQEYSTWRIHGVGLSEQRSGRRGGGTLLESRGACGRQPANSLNGAISTSPPP